MESPAPPSGIAPGPSNPAVGPQETDYPSPLQIPELLTLIGGYMDQPTLLASQLVCREWRRRLEPLVWADMRIVQSGSCFRDPMNSKFIRQHASSVQRLTIRLDHIHYMNGRSLDKSFCLGTIVFPRLTSIDINLKFEVDSSNLSEVEHLTRTCFG